MIKLMGMNNVELWLNEDQIEKIETVPESVITLSNGKKYIVLESNEEIVSKIIRFKSKIITRGIQEASSR